MHATGVESRTELRVVCRMCAKLWRSVSASQASGCELILNPQSPRDVDSAHG